MRLTIATSILCLSISPTMLSAAPLQGDAEAVRRVDAMLEQMGGKATWAKAKGAYIVYEQWRDDPQPARAKERAWRDLSRPLERLEWVWSGDPALTRSARGFDETAGWRASDGKVEALPPPRHAAYVSFWSRDFYTMFRRLAEGDPGLRVRMSGPSEVLVHEPGGTPLGWWKIDTSGNLLAWRAFGTTGNTLSYVYGPYKSFGKIRAPAWGAEASGGIRFEYTDFQVSDAPLPPEVFGDRIKAPAAETTLAVR